ncbi:MAG: 1-(5-phosphoribosyl)-5-[(5-phosphoribosylamino)methylideneamino]imidazole-4-carboxamide isomerase [Prevotellaceae bacterium]|nr:1-(5-phosphoribosyl)-5-[(5-phosphoribosylamino)methylideneamino]imidazole-4-carboxamide isomerase [Prevotellaceae bacterium]
MIQLIPAIDIIDGHCVRLTKGQYESKKVYDLSPLDIARDVERLGYKRLHVVDLDGAKSNHVVNMEALREITKHTKLLVDFGGGIKTDEDIKAVFDNGATYATVGSIAVRQPELMKRWIDIYGADRLILGADVKDGFISISGWQESSELRLIPFIRSYYELGIRRVLCTDISRDGMLQGTAVDLYKEIMQHFPDLQLIASGGVSNEQDIVILNKAGIPAVVFGKAIYEGHIDLATLAAKFPS